MLEYMYKTISPINQWASTSLNKAEVINLFEQHVANNWNRLLTFNIWNAQKALLLLQFLYENIEPATQKTAKLPNLLNKGGGGWLLTLGVCLSSTRLIQAY